MEHEDNNAQFDNFLQNRLAESLQMAAGAGQVAADVAGELMVPVAAVAANLVGSKSDEHHEDDEEWKYIQEVQQSEKQQQQQHHLHQQLQHDDEHQHHDLSLELNLDTGIVGNGLGNGRPAAPVGAYDYEEEDEVEVIKNDNDFSTNSNTDTTTSMGEAKEKEQLDIQLVHPLAEEQQQQQQHQLDQFHQLQQQQEQHEDEDEPSSVATTCGTTSSLSEHQPTPLELQQQQQQHADEQQQHEDEQQQHEDEQQQHEDEQQQQILLEPFDNKENNDPFSAANQSPLALNPHAVEFVPSFGSQPTSPSPIPGHINPQHLISGVTYLDEIVAESPRKGSSRDNMDTIAVPDELEFDNEASKRPHELEQADDVFGQEQEQLLNGSGVAQITTGLVADILDHGPETSVDLDPLEAISNAAPEEDVMDRSVYADHNISGIENILNSVQPLPNTQLDDEFAEKELLNVEEKEHISQSPSTEELQQQEQEQQQEHQLFAAGDPMQASFYLDHTSSDVQDPFTRHSVNQFDESLLLNTSAPFSPHDDNSPVTKLELEPQQAAVVDITPSPLSSTEEKHLVEETKEQQEYDQKQEEQLLLEPHNLLGSLVGAPSKVEEEEYAALNNAVTDLVDEAQHEYKNLSAALESNPFAPTQHFEKEIVNEIVTPEPVPEPENLETIQQNLQANYNELQLQEELIEEEHKQFTNGIQSSDPTPEPQVQVEKEEEEEEEKKGLRIDTPVQEEHQEPEKNLLIEASFKEPEPVPEQVPEEPVVTLIETQMAEEPPKVADPEPLLAVPIKDEPVLAAEPTPKSNLPEATVDVAAPVVAAAAVAGVAAVAATAAVAKSKGKVTPTEAKKPAAALSKTGVAAAKAKPAAAPTAAKKPATAAPTKTISARPRTAPATGAAKTTSSASTGVTAKPATTARKPLVSTATKSGPKTATTTNSARPATAPISKSSVPSTSSLTKTSSSTTSTATSARSASATTRRSVTTASTTTASSSAAQVKPRLASTTAGAPKPKVPSPRSTVGSTLRKTAPTSTITSTTSARSPTKSLANGVARSSATTTTTSTTRVKSATGGATNGGSSTTTTTTTTTTKTFTARPAPKFTHSTTTGTIGATGANSARRNLNVSASAAQRKPSPLKTTTTTRTSPLKSIGSANNSPLKPKAKESATTKTSPGGLKAKGAATTPGKVATNGVAKQESQEPNLLDEQQSTVTTHNGNGNGILHDEIEGLHQTQPASVAADVALLDF